MKGRLRGVEEVWELLRREIVPMSPRILDISLALGSVIAEDCFSDTDLPPFSNSAMDGYAVCAKDLQTASKKKPIFLKKSGELPAGVNPIQTVSSGTCFGIYTGAVVPPGADAVVPIEETAMKGECVSFHCSPILDQHIRHAGEDVRKGQLLFSAGHQVSLQDISLLASTGNSVFSVYRKPKISILSTGNELIPMNSKMTPGKIRNSNNLMIGLMAKRLGFEVKDFGVAQDDRGKVAEAFSLALESSDVVVTTGGVSVGKYDLVKDVLKEELGVEELFWRVNMKPGKPLFVGHQQHKKWVFALPGNPISAYVCFFLFVRFSLMLLKGRGDIVFPVLRGKLMEDFNSRTNRREYVRVSIKKKNNEFQMVPLKLQGSSCLSSLSESHGLMEIQENLIELKKGFFFPFYPWLDFFDM